MHLITYGMRDAYISKKNPLNANSPVKRIFPRRHRTPHELQSVLYAPGPCLHIGVTVAAQYAHVFPDTSTDSFFGETGVGGSFIAPVSFEEGFDLVFFVETVRPSVGVVVVEEGEDSSADRFFIFLGSWAEVSAARAGDMTGVVGKGVLSGYNLWITLKRY